MKLARALWTTRRGGLARAPTRPPRWGVIACVSSAPPIGTSAGCGLAGVWPAKGAHSPTWPWTPLCRWPAAAGESAGLTSPQLRSMGGGKESVPNWTPPPPVSNHPPHGRAGCVPRGARAPCAVSAARAGAPRPVRGGRVWRRRVCLPPSRRAGVGPSRRCGRHLPTRPRVAAGGGGGGGGGGGVVGGTDSSERPWGRQAAVLGAGGAPAAVVVEASWCLAATGCPPVDRRHCFWSLRGRFSLFFLVSLGSGRAVARPIDVDPSWRVVNVELPPASPAVPTAFWVCAPPTPSPAVALLPLRGGRVG